MAKLALDSSKSFHRNGTILCACGKLHFRKEFLAVQRTWLTQGTILEKMPKQHIGITRADVPRYLSLSAWEYVTSEYRDASRACKFSMA